MVARLPFLAVLYAFVGIYSAVMAIVIYGTIAYVVGLIPGMLLAFAADLAGIDNPGAVQHMTAISLVVAGAIAIAVRTSIALSRALRDDPAEARIGRATTKLAEEWRNAADHWPSRDKAHRPPRGGISKPWRLRVADRPRRRRAPAVERSQKELTGWRMWTVALDPDHDGPDFLPILASVSADAVWDRPHVAAQCHPLGDGRRRRHDMVPAFRCTCGIYAMKDHQDLAINWRGLVAVGQISMTGRVFEGTKGFRAARAAIAGPLWIRANCTGGGRYIPCPRPAVEITLDGATIHSACERHLPRRREPVGRPAEEMLEALVARLELRYGVDVRIDDGDEPWT